MQAPEGWGYGENPPQKGSYWYGTKEDAYLDERSNHPRLAKREAMNAYNQNKPPQVYPRVRANGPHAEWAQAIKDGAACGANFDYASRLTETCLLGVLAQRFGGRIEWDAETMTITNRKELNDFVREPVRKGWEYGNGFQVAGR